MIWVHAYETNLDRLRRYAAFSCGSEGLGDGVVSEALMDTLARVSSAENANLVTLFQKLDATLRNAPPGADSLFADLGRWKMLSPLERRVSILCILEGFRTRDVARITGLPRSEVKGLLGRARMIYADRFPARVGLVGGDDRVREAVEAALRSVGYSLLWRGARGEGTDPATLPPVSLVVVAHDGADVQQGIALCGGYEGPVILAHEGAAEDRLNSRHWTLPPEGLEDATLFCSTLVRALLFSD